jgi:hypothetical protein
MCFVTKSAPSMLHEARKAVGVMDKGPNIESHSGELTSWARHFLDEEEIAHL